MKLRTIFLVAGFTLASGCSDYLDVNTNPNAPQVVSANLYLAPMIHWMVTAPQFDGRFVGHYTQEWLSTSTNLSPASTWGRMGYDPGSDNGAEAWRDVYWSLGQNLIDMNNKAQAEERWDLLGVGLVLKAWGWQALTDLHGEIIIKEAIDQSRTAFDYDSEQFAYEEIARLLDSAIVLLQKGDGAVDPVYLARGDKMYNGNRTKWMKLAYGMKALSLNHFTNKSTYDPAAVIAAVDKSFAGNDDDALLAYPGLSTDLADFNFWGRTRNNITLYRQTKFILGLMDGTQFPGVDDPRKSRMLAISPDLTYRGLDPNVLGFGALTTAQQPNNFFGFPASGGTGVPGRYLFDDKAKIPVITYAQLQFIKAEAALRMGDQATALAAYTNGITAHFDFVNRRNRDNNQSPTQISAGELATYLSFAEIVPAVLTLSHIMSQKYIAQWGWAHTEIWMDMRRFHYTDVDPVSGIEVFRGFAPPTNIFGDNGGKVVQRMRPRFNSEYVWNTAALDVIGGRALDYQTKPLWIIQP